MEMLHYFSEIIGKYFISWDFESRIPSKISVIGIQDFTPVADPSISKYERPCGKGPRHTSRHRALFSFTASFTVSVVLSSLTCSIVREIHSETAIEDTL